MEMTVTETARHLPAACAVCTGHMGPFADTQVDLGAVEDQNGYGWLYVCRKCVGTMAALFGYITPDTASALLDKIDEIKAHAAETEDALLAEKASKVVSLAELQEAGLVLTAPEASGEASEAFLASAFPHSYGGREDPADNGAA